MHRELEALLREARRQPEDDPARLVLADWLDENGGEDDRLWAELIRLEVQLGLLHPDDPRRALLAARAGLLRQGRADWAGPLPGPLGLSLGRPAGGLCRLTIRPFHGRGGANWAGLAPLPVWPYIDGFHLLRPLDEPGWWRQHEAALSDLLAGPIAEGRGFLALGDATDEETALTLVEAPGLEQLTTLDLTASGASSPFLRPLLTSPRIKGLAWLALGDCNLTASTAGLLAASPYLGALRNLELCNNDLGPAGVERLGQARSHPASLGLALNNLGSAGVESLLATPLAPHLRSLDLGANGIGDRGVVLLATAPQLARLQRLHLDRNGLGPRGARALAESPYLGGLTYLYVNLLSLARSDQERLRHRFGDRVR